MIYLQLFYIFFKIGIFSFGGGLAMLPMVQEEVFKYNWLSEAEFLDIISISQVTPGPIVVNTATFVGHKLGGILGALSATSGVTFPSLIIILIVAAIFDRLKNNSYKEAFFRGVKPVTLALILYAGIIVGQPTFVNGIDTLSSNSLKSGETLFNLSGFLKPLIEFQFMGYSFNLVAIGIFFGTIYASKKIKVNPVFLLLGSGLMGLILL